MFYAAIAPLLPAYQDDLGLSKTAAGVLSASYAAGTLLGALPAGWLAGRIGAKQTMLIGLSLLSVSSLVFGLAESIVLLDCRALRAGSRRRLLVGRRPCVAAGSGPARASRRAHRHGTGRRDLRRAPGPGAGRRRRRRPARSWSSPASPRSAWRCSSGRCRRRRDGARSRPPGPSSERPCAAARFRPRCGCSHCPALFSGAIDVLVPLRLDELGASGLTIGAAFLVAAAIEGVLSPVLGRFSDRRGRLLPLRLGLVGVGSDGGAAAPARHRLDADRRARAPRSAALGCFWAPAAALLSDASEASGLDQGFAFGLMNLAWAGGQVVGGAAGGGAGRRHLGRGALRPARRRAAWRPSRAQRRGAREPRNRARRSWARERCRGRGRA